MGNHLLGIPFYKGRFVQFFVYFLEQVHVGTVLSMYARNVSSCITRTDAVG